MKFLLLSVTYFSMFTIYSQNEIYHINEVDSLPVLKKNPCNNIEEKKCLEYNLSIHFKRARIYPEIEYTNKIGGIVYTQFIISKEGNIKKIQTRSLNKSFEKEVEKVLKKLKGIQPAYKNNKPVNMVFNMPFYFKLLKIDTKFRLPEGLDSPPLFKNCISSDYDTEEFCFKTMIQKHIITHFNYPPLAIKKGIQGTVEISLDIDIDGSIKNIKLNSPHDLLTTEALKIVNSIPNLRPAIKNGNPINVNFSFPITYKIIRN